VGLIQKPRRTQPQNDTMTSRKLDEIASDIDDASTVVEELQVDPDADPGEKLDELQDILEHASDAIDEIDDQEIE
jgi:hypothetical protein